MTTSVLGPALLAAAVLAPLAGGLLAPPRRGDRRAAVAGGAVALPAALAVLLLAGLAGPVELGAAGGPGLAADRLGALLLALVALVGLIVQAFALRYLQGDPRAPRFFALTGLTVSATAVLVTSATLVTLTAAWIVAGAGLVALLAHERGLPAARSASRRAAATFAVGDGALVLATVLVAATVGDLSLRDPGTAAAALGAERIAGIALGPVVAVLVVVAALARSAQLPFGGWLAGTVAAPTPVSALLHGGVVNAGGILLVVLAPIVLLAPAAVGLAFAAGALTALWGTVLMLARPDVKGRLVHSTMGQMGFMVLQASIGALAAAVFHLVAHGMYKAALFLGSGSVVHERERRRRAPAADRPAGHGARDAALAPVLALALVVGAVALVAPGLAAEGGGIVLLAFAWASAAQAAYWWLRLRRPAGPLRAAAGVAALGAAVLGYVALLAGVKAFLAPDLPGDGAAGWAPAWLVALVLIPAGAALALRWLADAAPDRAARVAVRAAGLHRALYATARRAGEAPAPRDALRGAARLAPITRRPPVPHGSALADAAGGSR